MDQDYLWRPKVIDKDLFRSYLISYIFVYIFASVVIFSRNTQDTRPAFIYLVSIYLFKCLNVIKLFNTLSCIFDMPYI